MRGERVKRRPRAHTIYTYLHKRKRSIPREVYLELIQCVSCELVRLCAVKLVVFGEQKDRSVKETDI